MTGVIVGIDVGGTKTHVRVASPAGTLVREQVHPTVGWRGAGYPKKARQLAGWARDAAAGEALLAVAVGAHGCDSDEQCQSLNSALRPLVAIPTRVVNDAQLLGPAAGRDKAVGVIAGTGSIAAGWLPDGRTVFAGGWGWLLGDDGGAAGLVRDAVRALLQQRDTGEADPILTDCLLSVSGQASLGELSMAMMTGPGGDWTRLAPAVFAAADDGSALAKRVIHDGATALATLAAAVVAQGALCETVVAGGSVIVHQPRLAQAFTAAIAQQLPQTDAKVLTAPPVEGAIELARQLLEPTPNPQLRTH